MDENEDNRLSHLLALGQQGDRGAYHEFLRAAAERLRRHLSARIRRRDELEDVLQDTLLAIHRGRHTYSPGRPVAPWLYAICDHRVVDAFRKRHRMQKLESDWSRESAGTQAGVAAENRPLEQVLELVEKLPRKQRGIIELLKLRELPLSEVAALTGMSEGAVKVTAFRGYETIRRLLGLKKA